MRKVKMAGVWFLWVLLLIIEWGIDLIGCLWKVIHDSIKDLAIAIDKERQKLKLVNEPDSAAK
jgi:hypothetical protein